MIEVFCWQEQNTDQAISDYLLQCVHVLQHVILMLCSRALYYEV